MAVIKVSDDLRRRMLGETATAEPAASGTIKVSDALKARMLGNEADKKEEPVLSGSSAGGSTIKVSDALRQRMLGGALPAVDTNAQEDAAKYGIIEDPEDKLAEQLSKRYTTEGRMEQLEEIEDSKRFNTVYKDTFAGQTKANNAAAALAEKESLAWSAYLDSGNEADLAYAQGLSRLREQFTADNETALDNENVKAGWISKTMAGYLPQLASQAKYGVGGAVAGAAVGSVIPVAGTAAGVKAGYTAGQGLYGYQVMRGAAYKTLIDAGVDPETARKAAQDEGVVNGLIEAAEAGFTLASKGAKLLTMAGGKTAGKEIAADTLKTALKKYGINIGTEALQEGAQEAVSYANQNREDKGGGALNLLGEALNTGGQVLSGQNKEAAQQIREAAGEGAKIAAMFGAVSSAGSYLGQQRFSERIVDEPLEISDENGISLPSDGNVSAGFMQLAKQRISDFVDGALNTKGRTNESRNQRRISVVPQNVVDMVKQSSEGNIDLSNRYFALSGSDIYHEYDSHSNEAAEAARQQIAMNPEKMTEALAAFYDPDFVETVFADPNNSTQRQSFVYVKKADGYYIVAVAIGGKRNPNITPVMLFNISNEKMESWEREGKSVVRGVYEQIPNLFKGIDESALNKKNRVTAAAYEARNNELTAKHPRSPRFTYSVADGASAVNPQTAPSQYAANTMQQQADLGLFDRDTAEAFADASHRVISQNETAAAAQQLIETNGFDEVRRYLQGKMDAKQGLNSVEIEAGSQIAQQLSFMAKDPASREDAFRFIDSFTNQGVSDVGRALAQVGAAVRRMENGLLYYVANRTKKLGGVSSFSDEEQNTLLALDGLLKQAEAIDAMSDAERQATIAEYTADMGAEYAALANEAFTKVDEADSSADWVMRLAEKMVADKVGANYVDKYAAMQRINLLGNTKTQIRNQAGNITSFGLENASDVPAAIVDAWLQKKTGKRTVGTGSFAAAAQGGKQAVAEVNKARRLGVLGQLSNRYDESGNQRPGKVWSNNNKAGRLGNRLNDWTSYLLTVGDAMYSGAREAQVESQLRELNNSDASWISDVAAEAGRETTFQNDSELSRLAMSFRNVGKNLEGERGQQAVEFATRVIMPFVKTPANILSRTFSYSPAGLIEGAFKAYDVIKAGADADPIKQRRAAVAIGRGLTGTLVSTVGMGLAAAGKASGKAPEDKDEAAFMKDVGGVLPNALKFGDTWVDLSNLGPGMVALNAGATVYNNLVEEGFSGNVAWRAVQALLDSAISDVTGDSLWQGVLDTAAYIQEGNYEGLAADFVGDILSQIVPAQSFLRAITGSVDKYKRETSAEGDIGWSVNYILSNIPGFSQNMPIKYDVTGEAVERYEGGKASDIFNAWLNPASAMSKDKTDSDLYKQVMSLYEQTGDSSIFPTVAPYSISYQGQKYALRGADRSEYQQTSGKDITAQLDELFNSAAYKQATSEQQVEMMADLISNSTANAKSSFLSGKDITYQKSGISSAIDKLAAYDVPASAVVLLAATDTSNDNNVTNSGAVKAAKAAIKLGLSTEAEYALIEHYGSKVIAECVQTARELGADPASYLDTYQALQAAENAATLKTVLQGTTVSGSALLSMLTDTAETRYSRFDNRWTVNGRSYTALRPESYVAFVCCLDSNLNKAANVKRLMEFGLSETAAGDFYTLYKSNSTKYD